MKNQTRLNKMVTSVKDFFKNVFSSNKKQSYKSYKLRKKMIPYLFLTPNLLIFSIFIILPAFIGLYYSFTDVSFLKMDDYNIIGFQNYINLFQDEEFLSAIGRTGLLIVIVFPIVFVFAIGLALLIVKPLKAKGVFRASYYWPVMISAIVVGIIWNWIMGGTFSIFNKLWTSIGFDAITLTNKTFAWIVVVFATVWSRLGYYMVIFMAALLSISPSLYEAADVDGANKWQKFWGVTYPALKPARLMVTILLIMEIFKTYPVVVTLTGGGPLDSTTYIVMLIRETAFAYYDVGYASAMTIMLLVFVTILSGFNFYLNKGGTD